MEQSGVGSPISLSETCPAYLSWIVPCKQEPIVLRRGPGKRSTRSAAGPALVRGGAAGRGGHRPPGGSCGARECRDQGALPSPRGCRERLREPARRPVRVRERLTRGSSWLLSRPRHELLSRFRPAALAVTQPPPGQQRPWHPSPFPAGSAKGARSPCGRRCGSAIPAVLLGPRCGTAKGRGSGAVLGAPLLGKGQAVQGLDAG